MLRTSLIAQWRTLPTSLNPQTLFHDIRTASPTPSSRSVMSAQSPSGKASYYTSTRRCLSIANTYTVADATATNPIERLPKALEQLLEHCDRDRLPALEDTVRIIFAGRYRVLNAQHSPLLKHPTELLVEVGKLILASRSGRHDKKWYQTVLPLLQTCAQLRSGLYPLRSERLEHVVSFREDRVSFVDVPTLWDQTLESLANWHHKGSHQGTVAVYIQPSSACVKSPSALAAIAGALECKIYGRLLQPPAINFRAPYTNPLIYGYGFPDRHHYINHRHVSGIEEVCEPDDGTEQTVRCLSIEEGTQIWHWAEIRAKDQLQALSQLNLMLIPRA